MGDIDHAPAHGGFVGQHPVLPLVEQPRMTTRPCRSHASMTRCTRLRYDGRSDPSGSKRRVDRPFVARHAPLQAEVKAPTRGRHSQVLLRKRSVLALGVEVRLADGLQIPSSPSARSSTGPQQRPAIGHAVVDVPLAIVQRETRVPGVKGCDSATASAGPPRPARSPRVCFCDGVPPADRITMPDEWVVALLAGTAEFCMP